jgi:hypothetical protein
VTGKREDGGADPRFGSHERYTDRASHRYAPEAHRTAGKADFLKGINDQPPFGNGLSRAPGVVPHDKRADRLARRPPPAARRLPPPRSAERGPPVEPVEVRRVQATRGDGIAFRGTRVSGAASGRSAGGRSRGRTAFRGMRVD